MKTPKPPTPESFVARGTAAAELAKAAMPRMTPPRDPATVFAELADLISAGAMDMARELFFADASTRERWSSIMGRKTTEAYSKLEGAIGGTTASAGNKRPSGHTPTQDRRAARLAEMRALGIDDARALNTMATEDGCSAMAIRQSLTKAGVVVSTKARQGTRNR